MRLLRHLQHWLRGSGPRLQVADVVPKTNSIRQWTDTFPWAKLVEAVEHSFASRFPKRANGGRHPVPTRVLLALELLKHEVGASDEAICERLRTDVAVMYACGLDAVQLDSPQAHFVLPETLAQFRSRIDDTLIDELLALQAAAAMDEGLVSPAHLLVEPFPRNRAANASPMPPPFTRLKKSPPTRLALHHPSDHVEEPSPRAPARPAKSHALLWPPMPRSGQNLREAGAPNRNATVRTLQLHRRPGAGGAPGPPDSAPSERGHAGALGKRPERGTGGASADQHPIPTADPRQKAAPL